MVLLNDIIELAKEIERTDPIDFAMLQLDEESAYKTIGLELIEKNLGTPEEHRNLILMAKCLHLVIDNMVLNMKLMEKY